MKNYKLLMPILLVLIMGFALFKCKSQTGDGSVAVDTVKIAKVGSTGKQVAMSHEVHEKAGVKCITCHHKEGNDDRIKKCQTCHDGDEGKDLMHDLCIDCHKGMKKGPTGCLDCHKI